jgi:hypothetical protein
MTNLFSFRGNKALESVRAQSRDIADKIDAVASDVYRWILEHTRNDYTLPIVGDIAVFGSDGLEDKILSAYGELDGTRITTSMRICPCACGCCGYYIQSIKICVDDVYAVFCACGSGNDLKLRRCSEVLGTEVPAETMAIIGGITKFLDRFLKHFYIAMNVARHQRVSKDF